MKKRTFSVDRIEGEPHRPVVVLLPGLFVSDWVWEPVWERFRELGWPALKVTEPLAFADPQVARSVESLGTQLWDVIAASAGPDAEVVLCGYSLGGVIAMDLATRLGDGVVTGLVLSGMPGLGSGQGFGFVPQTKIKEKLVARLIHDRSVVSDEQIDRAIDFVRGPRAGLSIARALKAVRRYDVESQLGEIRVPTLLLWGDHDLVAPVEPWVEAVQQMHDGELVVFEECGHVTVLERPALVTQHLERFLLDRFDAEARV